MTIETLVGGSKSFICSTKGRGPSLVPWGTPPLIVTNDDSFFQSLLFAVCLLRMIVPIKWEILVHQSCLTSVILLGGQMPFVINKHYLYSLIIHQLMKTGEVTFWWVPLVYYSHGDRHYSMVMRLTIEWKFWFFTNKLMTQFTTVCTL